MGELFRRLTQAGEIARIEASQAVADQQRREEQRQTSENQTARLQNSIVDALDIASDISDLYKYLKRLGKAKKRQTAGWRSYVIEHMEPQSTANAVISSETHRFYANIYTVMYDFSVPGRRELGAIYAGIANGQIHVGEIAGSNGWSDSALTNTLYERRGNVGIPAAPQNPYDHVAMQTVKAYIQNRLFNLGSQHK